MPTDPTRLCKCHGEAMYRDRRGKTRCRIKSIAGTARKRREFPAEQRVHNTRRLMAGETYLGLAKSPEQAQAINAHIRRRIDVFKQGQQARKEAQGAS